MALFKILKGNESNLPAKKTEGYAYFTEDKGNFFVDVSSSKRMQLNANHAQYDLEEFTSPTGQNSAKLPIHEKYLRISGGVVDGNITADTFIGVHKGNILGVTETEPTSVTSYSPLFINTGGSAANATTEYSRRANQDFNIRMLQGTASVAGYAVLDLGNATATGTAGNKYGAIKLFSEKTGSVTLKSNTASTSNVTATFPAYSGNVTISATSAQNPTSAATYNIPFYINNSNRVSYNDGLRYNTIEGTASALGQSNLYLGNSTASGTAKNKYGCILIYGQNANYTRLRARQTPAFNQSTFYLPAGDEANDACYAIWSPNEATAVGSATQPVYIAANGKAVACTAYSGGTAVTLNGTSKAGSTASIYTPTAAGTNGQILASTGGAPGWVNQSTIAAGTAAKLANTRAINGTNFDGTADITTARWGTARTISISGTAGTTGTSINGSANATLTIPTTLSGFTKITSTSFVGALTGNADTATKLKTARTINGTSFDGSANITTAKWGTARTVSISSAAGTTGTSVNGSANVSLVIPKTMTGFTSITSTTFVGALNGNATTASALTDLTSNDLGSSTSTKRYVWFSYDNNTTGRPAYSPNFTYQVKEGLLRVEKAISLADKVKLEYIDSTESLDFIFI